jgi:hypothetical protein
VQLYNVWCATIWSPVVVSTPSAPLTAAIPVVKVTATSPPSAAGVFF